MFQCFHYRHADSVHLLYAAGCSIEGTKDEEEEFSTFPQFIQDDQQPLLPLQGLCRRQIRRHLLSPSGGNHGNLIAAVPLLPLPTEMKKYLLFNVEHILEASE